MPWTFEASCFKCGSTVTITAEMVRQDAFEGPEFGNDFRYHVEFWCTECDEPRGKIFEWGELTQEVRNDVARRMHAEQLFSRL